MRKLTNNARNVSESKVKELKAEALRILSETRRSMMQRQPFTGSVAMNLEIVPVREISLETAATDGKNVFFDIDFLSTLNQEERLFVFAHEVWHNLMCHFSRGENRDRELMNIATDLEVNQILVKDGFCLPKSALMPGLYGLPPDLSAEEYYALLSEQGESSKSKGKPSDQHIYSGDQDGQGQGQGQGQDQDDQNGQGQGQDEGQDDQGQELSDKYGKLGHDPDFRPSDPKDAVERVREAAVSAAQTMERMRGSLPDYVKGLVQALLKPEINWREQLQQFVTRSCCGENRSWNPPNRRHVHSGTYLQSRKGEKIKVGVVIDTSGSTSNDIPKFLGELNGLVKTFGKYSLNIVQCDTEVKDYTEYTDDDPLDLENVKFEISGGGWTILMPGIKYFEDTQLNVDCIIVFTDMYCEDMPEENAPDVPVLWLSTTKGSHDNIKFGEIIEFNDQK